MKKIITVMLVGLFLASSVKAQVTTLPLAAGDSLATADSVIKKISISAGYASVGFQVSIKKGTGTLDGKFYLYTSVNGNSYVLTDSASFAAVPTFGSLNSNGIYTHTAIINKTAPAGSKFIAVATQTGSLTASPVQVSYAAKRHD